MAQQPFYTSPKKTTVSEKSNRPPLETGLDTADRLQVGSLRKILEDSETQADIRKGLVEDGALPVFSRKYMTEVLGKYAEAKNGNR